MNTQYHCLMPKVKDRKESMKWLRLVKIISRADQLDWELAVLIDNDLLTFE